MERKPDFEDDKIRMWVHPQEGGGLPSRKEDPTVMSINLETEEIYESRTYRLRPTAENLQMIMRIASTSTPERSGFPLPLSLALAEELLRDAALKFLAKRHKDDGDISLLIATVALGDRYLVRPLRRMSEQEYRDKVDQFEAEWVSDGPLEPGFVTTLDEWRRYGQGLLPEEQKPSKQRPKKERKKRRRRR